MKLLDNVLNHFWINIKLDWEHQWEEVVWFFIVFVNCITVVTKSFQIAVNYM